MPTVLRFDGLRVVIYPNDHRPAHVHVKGAGGEAVVVSNCPDGPLASRESLGFSRTEVGGVEARLIRHLVRLLEGLAEATPRSLAAIEISPSGLGLHWPSLDADVSVPALLSGVFGTAAWRVALGRDHSRADDSVGTVRRAGR